MASATSIPLFHSIWQEQDIPTALFEALLNDETPNALSPSERVEALTQLARCQGLSSQFDTAHLTLDSIPAKDRPAGSTAQVRWLLEKGRVLRSSGKSQDPETRACFLAAYNEAKEDFFKVDAAHMLAIIDPTGAPTDAAPGETWTSGALKISQASANPNTQMWAASLLHNSAWDSMDAGKPQDALAQFKGALELRKRAFQQDPSPKNRQTYRISRWAVARALRECGENKDAFDIQQTLWTEAQTGPVQDEIAILKPLLGIVD
ncbi:hypothetical protein DFH08DRAFT_870246 [Mycena albidolilacea]|uniref:Uncharacterized protein n=1 Tax=Mycena albidolilacea TaxID=1033008 RepID=A0AAD7A0H8_9AGAR|nr:hypothetical protein DFH08DRAFT_870246 [Mycena albidolilacea]